MASVGQQHALGEVNPAVIQAGVLTGSYSHSLEALSDNALATQVLVDGQIVPLETAAESAAERRERLWAEARLTHERNKLARDHITRPFAETLEVVRAAWRLERYAPAVAAAELAQQAANEAGMSALAAAQAEHEAAVLRTSLLDFLLLCAVQEVECTALPEPPPQHDAPVWAFLVLLASALDHCPTGHYGLKRPDFEGTK
jgi:hypothetical protein